MVYELLFRIRKFKTSFFSLPVSAPYLGYHKYDVLEVKVMENKEKEPRILLAPSYELAMEAMSKEDVKATVEAEYGSHTMLGELITMAHHGTNSHNPAPCNWGPVPQIEDGVILVSHLDLDTIGGVMKLLGIQPEDPEFWYAAEFIDTRGPHHAHELPEYIQDKLNAFEAYSEPILRTHYDKITDVTNQVYRLADAITYILEPMLSKSNRYKFLIENGKEWAEEKDRIIEERLVSETANVRLFVSDGVFCSSAYYSPKQNMIIPGIVVYNFNNKSITISFSDDVNISACDVAQYLWGPEAGGHKGIAGSPRGMEMEYEDAVHAADYIESLFGDILQSDHELFDSDSVSPELDQNPSYKCISSTQNDGSLSEDNLEEFEEDYGEDYEIGDEL
jgi:hypothetical protein